MDRLKRFLPNMLSGFRLLAALLFPFSPQQLWLPLILIAAVTDILDGWLARQWQVTSWQGGLLDAVADKLFVLTVCIVFSLAGKMSLFWVPVILARDILVACTAVYFAVRRLWQPFTKMAARPTGKIATAGQFTLFFTLTLAPNHISLALAIAAVTSIIAAYDYLKLFLRTLSTTQHHP